MRIDRAVSLYLGYPLARICIGAGIRIPILMYHSVSSSSEDGVHPYYRVNTAPEVFEIQMRLLHEQGFKALTLSEAAAILCGRETTEQPAVVITFDDGYRDFYREAYPILKRYGLTATVYLPTAFVGNSALRFKERECLTWTEVREMAAGGIEFGSHTVNHPRLVELPRSEVIEEITDSRQVIHDRLGVKVRSFAVPYAFPEQDLDFVKFLKESLQNAGYENGVTTILGTAAVGNDVYFLRRLPVNSLDDQDLFRAKLSGAYDWLRFPQLLSKKAASWL